MITLEDLIKRGLHISNIHPSRRDWRVVIVTKDPSMGGRRRVEVEHINSGFDWEHGDIILTPKEDLVVKGPTIDEFIQGIPSKVYDKIRKSQSNAECRRYLKQAKDEIL